jgi:hypothetical protein
MDRIPPYEEVLPRVENIHYLSDNSKKEYVKVKVQEGTRMFEDYSFKCINHIRVCLTDF